MVKAGWGYPKLGLEILGDSHVMIETCYYGLYGNTVS